MTTSFALGPRVRRSRNRPADLAFALRTLDLAGRGGGLPSPLEQRRPLTRAAELSSRK
jgi:hypothetical protein